VPESSSTIDRPALAETGDAPADPLALQRTAVFSGLVRAGFIVRGVTYGVIGGLAAAFAVGAGSQGTPTQEGALELISGAPSPRAC